MKINEKSRFSTQIHSKTSCNLPRAPWKRHRACWSRPNASRRTLRRPSARARGDWPASKLVPGDFWQHYYHKFPFFLGFGAPETSCNIASLKHQRTSWSHLKLCGLSSPGSWAGSPGPGFLFTMIVLICETKLNLDEDVLFCSGLVLKKPRVNRHGVKRGGGLAALRRFK